ncbi:hypothetical protein GLOIN_2v1478893 [Rhizophagus irregularis DAOM 181602=DAOM 197198]|nr:hypothetical protein GLOIN_2v1478893 [Rhizophagus irregularis DAOM 181602=DAOM 197198]
MWSITLEKENISYCTSALIIIRRSTPIDQHRISNDFELSREHRHTLILILTDLQVINQMSTTGSYLTFVFSLNRQYSKDVVNKYFKRLRELLKDKLLAIKNRTSRTKKIINELKRLSILARLLKTSGLKNKRNVKKVHSNRLDVSYIVTVRKYNSHFGIEWNITQKGRTITERNHYKEYSKLKFDIVRSPQQITHWNRLTKSVLNQEYCSDITKPYILT